MEVRQGRWTESGWSWQGAGDDDAVTLVMAFGGEAALARPSALDALAFRFRNAALVGCSTDGEVEGGRVFADTIVATAIRFEHTAVQVAEARIVPGKSQHEAGVQLSQLLARDGLAHLFVMSSAVSLDPAELTRCLGKQLPRHVGLTGGVARSVCYHGQPTVNAMVAIGFFGHRLHIGYGTLHGKDPFGSESRNGFGGRAPELAILTSTGTNRLAPTQRVEEEVRSLREMLGPTVALTGFCAVSALVASTQGTTVTTLREE